MLSLSLSLALSAVLALARALALLPAILRPRCGEVCVCVCVCVSAAAAAVAAAVTAAAVLPSPPTPLICAMAWREHVLLDLALRKGFSVANMSPEFFSPFSLHCFLIIYVHVYMYICTYTSSLPTALFFFDRPFFPLLLRAGPLSFVFSARGHRWRQGRRR